MSKRRASPEIRDYVDDIIEMIDDITEFTKGLSLQKFKKDKKTVYAVIRCLEVIGKASNQIPSSIKKAHSEIPWDSIAGMRNKLIHEYFGADMMIVWSTIQNDLESLAAVVQEIRKELDER